MPRDRRNKRKRAKTQRQHSDRIIDLTQAKSTIYHNVGNSPHNPIILGEPVVPIEIDFSSNEEDPLDFIVESSGCPQSSPSWKGRGQVLSCNYSRGSSRNIVDDMLTNTSEQFTLSPSELRMSAVTPNRPESQINPRNQSSLDETGQLSFNIRYCNGTGSPGESITGKESIYQPVSPTSPIQESDQLNPPVQSPINATLTKSASGAMHSQHFDTLSHCQTDIVMLEANGGLSVGRSELGVQCLITAKESREQSPVPRWSLKSVHANTTPFDQLFESMTHSGNL
ncbi:hypothetical protein BD410DRAFT_423383 [Rickenella mellea]|uniref:Uncharacterized protein n=1 Tax=Rickenella mellea TaxID=50990 RepID=A0A4Y7QIP2_9AGAM|nr:hypothetical protein BD410DRAFT_423383 [Rickenella mellea]